jgi:hypothetical protein
MATNPTPAQLESYRGKPPPVEPDLGFSYSLGDPRLNKWFQETLRFYEDNIEYNGKLNTLTLYFSHPYEIGLDRIKTHRDLLRWTLHLMQKPWMSPDSLRRVVLKIAALKNLPVL